MLIESSPQEQGYLLWLAICRSYRFIADFAVEVLHERYINLTPHLKQAHFDAYFNRKAEWHPELEQITSSTCLKARQILFRMLREANLLTQSYAINPVVLSHRLIEHLGQQYLIAVINDRLRYFEDQGYQKLLAKMVALATPKSLLDPDDHGHAGEQGKGKPGKPNEQTNQDAIDSKQVAKPTIEYILARQIQIAYDKAWLANEQDVERYLESMREALIAEIRKGKRVQV